MKNIIILGANGQIARLVTERLLNETDYHLTLYLRNSNRISVTNPERETVVDGDVYDLDILTQSMEDQDIVYANLEGDYQAFAKNIIQAMDQTGVNRLIDMSALGIYNELPDKFQSFLEGMFGSAISNMREAADVIEGSDVNYTLIRAAYMNNDDKIDYETTQKGKKFKGTIISRKSIAEYIMKLIKDPELDNYSSVGIAQPNTNADCPKYWEF